MLPVNKSDLSTDQAEFVELMQRLAFGFIERLVVRDGHPVVEAHTRVIRDIKLGASNGPRPELALPDFALKASVQELLDVLAANGNATVRCLEIKHGLPFRIQVEDTPT